MDPVRAVLAPLCEQLVAQLKPAAGERVRLSSDDHACLAEELARCGAVPVRDGAASAGAALLTLGRGDAGAVRWARLCATGRAVALHPLPAVAPAVVAIGVRAALGLPPGRWSAPPPAGLEAVATEVRDVARLDSVAEVVRALVVEPGDPPLDAAAIMAAVAAAEPLLGRAVQPDGSVVLPTRCLLFSSPG